MSTSKTVTHAFSGSKTSNIKAALEILKDVGKILEAVPYLEGVAGILKIIVDMKQESTESNEEWERTMDGVRDLLKIVEGQARDIHDRTLVIPEYLKEATAGLESCVERIVMVFEKIEGMKHYKRILRRRELKADAVKCSSDVDRALSLFRTKLQFKMAIQINDLHAGSGGTVTSGSARVSLPVCPFPSDLFTGRVALLEELDKLLTGPARRTVTIVAKGGSGKTQLVLKFVEEQKSRFSQVFFVDASSAETISSVFGLIAKAGGVGGSVEDARNWFAGNSEEWLLILDNADDLTLDLGQYIPHSSRGKIIVTSRNYEVSRHASSSPNCSIHLPDLDESDAVDLLLKSARLDSKSCIYHVSALAIVKELGFMTLAITHAGAYISQSCQLQDYLSLFRSQSVNLLKEHKTQSINGYPHTVFSTLDLSYQRLSDSAKALLHVLSFFHHSNVPLQIFSCAAKNVFVEESNSLIASLLHYFSFFTSSQRLQSSVRHNTASSMKLLREFLSPYWDASQEEWLPVTFLETVSELQQHSIVSFDTSIQTLSLHSIVHMWARDIVPVQDLAHATALEILSYATPRSSHPSVHEVTLLLQLASHASYLYNMTAPLLVTANIPIKTAVALIFYHAGFLEKELFVRKEILHLEYKRNITHKIQKAKQALAITYSQLGEYSKAERLQQEALKWCNQTHGKQHQATCDVMTNLAATYSHLGRHLDAKKLEEKVLKWCKQSLGEEHPNTWDAMSNLAITYTELGQYLEAEKIEQEVLRLHTQILGEQHPDTWKAMAGLSITYRHLGQYTEAEKLQQKVIKWRQQVMGQQHPDTCDAIACLADTYHCLRHYTKAKKLKEEVLKLRQQVLGQENVDTQSAMRSLASTCRQLGQFIEAQKLEQEILQWHKQVLGEQHPDTWKAMTKLASTYCQLGQFDQAQNLVQEVLRSYRKSLGDNHPCTRKSMKTLASIYSRLGQFIETKTLEQEILQWHRKVMGEQHPDTWKAMANLAHTCRQLGQFSEAQKLEQELLKWHRQVLGDQHPYTRRSMTNLASTYHQLGNFCEVQKLQEEILQWYKEIKGEQHPDTWKAMKNLALTYYELDQYTKAKKLAQEVLRWHKQILGEQHPDTCHAMQNLAATYRQLGHHSKVKKLDQEVLKWCKQFLGEQNPDTWNAMADLASTYYELGQFVESEKLEQEVLRWRRQVLGDQHLDTRRAKGNLATIYHQLGQVTQAEKLEQEVQLSVI